MRVTKTQIYDFIKEKLSTDSKWQLKALLEIYKRQTQGERDSNSTFLHNDVGFSGCDAEILSSFAKQYISRRFLSQKQMEILARKMKKYWKQIYDISDKPKLIRIMFNMTTESTALLPKPVTLQKHLEADSEKQLSLAFEGYDEGER